ncbi:MAG: biotin/lipoyl-containing protein [Myxococcota bacterium]|nr:biotin/lipoyl-containing protein [Myxococcota bacterium]
MRTPDLDVVPFHEADSAWARSFTLARVKCLIVCRGPVRKEAFEVFDEIGIGEYGMLLSQKDSVVYPRCLAPELRQLRFPDNVHRVEDYMGAGQQEKLARIGEIVEIAKTNGYTHIFAGYGFMAEDVDFIEAIEDSGLRFIGPSSPTIRLAGAKDEAKKLARRLGNAVIPGIDNVSALALTRRAGDRSALEGLASEHGLDFSFTEDRALEENAEALLQAGYDKTVELVTIAELQAEAEKQSKQIWEQYSDARIRFKAIGGGGGKGQRVVGQPTEVQAAVMDVIAEQKLTAPGSNRNFLIELNLEQTRHNEIQLLGNGDWCISLGGRDCSIQMHEQKQLEFSLNMELLDLAIEEYEGESEETLKKDRETLQRMEDDGEQFGAGAHLDSVSTFECIVEGFNHFFMEMNTRIQVEHGVSELVYRLKFTNPDDSSDFFYVDRLIEAMALVELHGSRLPKPERVPRSVSGGEIRVNATNSALRPHAGGLIRSWTRPLDFEIRDDQGIGTRNPDTDSFVYYNLAGAYDSNIALILADGSSRANNLERMSEILRQMSIRGADLQTNCPVQYGLINWILGVEPMLKPDTGFLTNWLAAVGALKEVAQDVDLAYAAGARLEGLPDSEARKVFAAKETLLLRPMGRLLGDPHALAGFLGLTGGRLWQAEGERIRFADNPVVFLRELYHYLDMDFTSDKPPAVKIWEDDWRQLRASLDFYEEVSKRTGIREWPALEALFEGDSNAEVAGTDNALWQRCVAAHNGFQLGLDLLLVIPRVGMRAGFQDVTVDKALEPVFPQRFRQGAEDSEIEALTRRLAPPPTASADEIVAPSGGAFYSREAPHLSPLIEQGQHFEEGQPLFVIEVMKMFNKVLAPFSGTIVECCMQEADGSVIKVGQTIFRVEPDEVIEEESEDVVRARRRELTLSLLA